VIGLSNDKSMDSLAIAYYGTLEFIALQTHPIVESMNSAGHVLSSIFMSGSQCQNDVLMNLIATACQMPVMIPRYVHAAVVHGAAMLGAKAASSDKEGVSEPLWDIMDRLSKPGKAVYPSSDEGEKKLLEAKYRVFLEQIAQQQKYKKELDEVVAGWKR
jgi:ribulose kinase